MIRSIHFIGIGGIGMSGIAKIILKQGNRVSGSDIKESEATRELNSLGANVFIGHDASHLGDVDLVVYSSAINPKNPELVSAIKKNIPVVKRAQLLAELMKDKKGITVAGAHGKTTTTSLVSFMLNKSNFRPTVVTGGNVFNFNSNALLGEGAYFVAELDESDESFLYFNPTYSIVTNIDYEHLDHYKTWDNILNAFSRFFDQTQKNGLIFACGDDKNIMDILKHKNQKFISFGLSQDCDIYADKIYLQDFSSRFECIYRDKLLGQVVLNIPGRHNISNSLSVIALGLELGIGFDKIKDCLFDYKGVGRRFQLKGQANSIKIVDDYGHHPTEIRATLAAAKSMKPKRLVVAFQPHRYSRTKFLLEEFATCFDSADSLIITDIYAANEKPIPGITSRQLLKKIKQINKKDVVFLHKKDIVRHLLKIAKPGDLIMTLGAGDIGKLSDELLQRLKEAN
jgi:UDP-N-acetylmuramate--alanine ligase